MMLAEDVTLTVTEHGAVLLDQRSGRYWQLNRTGCLIVEELDRTGTIQPALDELQQRFPTSASQVTADAERLVESLVNAKLVTP
ncbi:lasso peptide biosynthesis PqqD family chaperone [Amycolatopsis sp. NBC_00345]|uniref:lasso peptide biosynthesis PqqD family chaperone n=1 Tax=Amycolatopsis sp. NBC_00345 TaxID=2975955 RepID=UPI002E25DA64